MRMHVLVRVGVRMSMNHVAMRVLMGMNVLVFVAVIVFVDQFLVTRVNWSVPMYGFFGVGHEGEPIRANGEARA